MGEDDRSRELPLDGAKVLQPGRTLRALASKTFGHSRRLRRDQRLKPFRRSLEFVRKAGRQPAHRPILGPEHGSEH